MATQTLIQLKSSVANSAPQTLDVAEPAYSFVSKKLFIGNTTNSVITIGGQYYTDIVDAATNSSTPNTLVKRDSSGNASFNYVHANIIGHIDGVATEATALETARDFSISGGDMYAGAVSFDGTGNVTLNASLNTVPGLVASSYGSTTQVPVINVASNGRVMAISTQTISTSLNISGDTGTNSVSLLTDTLDFQGSKGITTSVSGNQITFGTDNTIVRSNTPISLQTIDGNLAVSGNVYVSGNTFTTDVQTLNIADPLIYLASNNYVSDVVDIGFVANYFDGSSQRHTGVFRNAGDKEFYVFDNYDKEPSDNVINVDDASFRIANLHANLISPTANIQYLTVSGVANTISDLGVGNNLYVTNNIKGDQLLFNGTTASVSITDDSIVLTNGAGALSGIQFGGHAYLLGPDGARNAQLGYGGRSGEFGIYKANVYSGTASTSTLTGALVVQGGTGITGNVNIGAALTVSGTTTLTGQANTTNDLGVGGNAYVTGTLSASSLTLTNALPIASGGTNNNSFNVGELITFDGTSIKSLANTGTSGTYGAKSRTLSVTTDALGRVSSISNNAIEIDTTQIITGTLGTSRGGTGYSTLTANGVFFADTSSSFNFATGSAFQVLQLSSSGIPVFGGLDGGTF